MTGLSQGIVAVMVSVKVREALHEMLRLVTCGKSVAVVCLLNLAFTLKPAKLSLWSRFNIDEDDAVGRNDVAGPELVFVTVDDTG